MSTALQKKIAPITKRLAAAIRAANLSGHAYTCSVARIGIELAHIRHLHLTQRGGHEEGFQGWLEDDTNWQLTRQTAYNYIYCAGNVLREAGWEVTLDNLHTYTAADITKAEKATADLKLGDMKKSLDAPEPEPPAKPGKPAEEDEEETARQLFLPLFDQISTVEHHADDLHLLPFQELRALRLKLQEAAKLAHAIEKDRT